MFLYKPQKVNHGPEFSPPVVPRASPSKRHLRQREVATSHCQMKKIGWPCLSPFLNEVHTCQQHTIYCIAGFTVWQVTC